MVELIIHNIEPVYNKNSRILILGSLPSPASRSFGFYYGHPQNIFWPLLASLLGEHNPEPTIEARREFALTHRVALWDVLHSAEISGADDSSIKNPVVNDFTPFTSELRRSFAFLTSICYY